MFSQMIDQMEHKNKWQKFGSQTWCYKPLPKCKPGLVATVISYLVENKRYCCVHIQLKSLFAFWDNNSPSFPVLVANPRPNTSSTEENLSACFRSKTLLFCVSGPSCKVAKTAKKPIHYLLITGRYLCYSLLSVFFFKCFQIRITTLKPYFIATEGTYQLTE